MTYNATYTVRASGLSERDCNSLYADLLIASMFYDIKAVVIQDDPVGLVNGREATIDVP